MWVMDSMSSAAADSRWWPSSDSARAAASSSPISGTSRSAGLRRAETDTGQVVGVPGVQPGHRPRLALVLVDVDDDGPALGLVHVALPRVSMRRVMSTRFARVHRGSRRGLSGRVVRPFPSRPVVPVPYGKRAQRATRVRRHDAGGSSGPAAVPPPGRRWPQIHEGGTMTSAAAGPVRLRARLDTPSESVAVVGQMAAGHSARCRPRLPLDGVRGAQRRRVLRDPGHRPVPAVHLRPSTSVCSGGPGGWAYYAYGALGTDRYPPFTLGAAPDYPATLDVAYPEHLSRGLVLVKWWLLALPHYLIVAVLPAAAATSHSVRPAHRPRTATGR